MPQSSNSSLPGLFDFLQGLGDGLQMIGIELFFVDLFGIEAGIDLDLDDKSLVTQLSSAQIAREVQHEIRILPELESAGPLPHRIADRRTVRRNQNLFRTAGDSSEVFKRTCATHALVHLSTPSIVSRFCGTWKAPIGRNFQGPFSSRNDSMRRVNSSMGSRQNSGDSGGTPYLKTQTIDAPRRERPRRCAVLFPTVDHDLQLRVDGRVILR